MKTITPEQIQSLRDEFKGTERAKESYPVFCPGCGWYGMSDDTTVCQLADTGDYTDPECPVCESEVQDVEHLTGLLR